MIKVLIERERNNFKSLKVKGHANSAPYGKDLVCAAVSAVLTGGLNNLNDASAFDIKLESGDSLIKAIKTISSHDEIVIETIIRGLETIQESNGDYIEIKNL